MTSTELQTVKDVDNIPYDLPVGTMIKELTIVESLSEEVCELNTQMAANVAEVLVSDSMFNSPIATSTQMTSGI